MKRGNILSLTLVAALSASTLTACAKKPAQRPMRREVQAPSPAYLDHVIQYSGETLAVISAWYTGRASNWNYIRDVNPGLNPQRLRLGQTVRIPADLATRSEPMPKEFVRRFVRGEEKAPSNDPGLQPTPEATPADQGVVTESEVAPESTPAPVVSESPAPTPQAAALPPVPTSTVVPAVKIETPPSDDAEREKLLDELLN
ncbi:MAG: hypothetical protein IT290_11315 [Deltaproteobacteria bacterium]|nr:hypothetical protein [Deltaproteobacteria bacterium]